jgi:hypothetical protein
MAKKKQTLAQRIAADPKLKAKYLANPGLRAKLPPSMLTPAQRKVRETNAYNSAPITEGSAVTNKQLATEADNAATVQFGGLRQQYTADQNRAQSLGRDQNDWYNAYRAELAQHATNTRAIGDAAVAQIGQLGQGARALDQSQSTAQQQAMAADAANRGATVDPATAQNASDASQVRQQMLAGFGSQQAGVGAAHSQYADTLAHVVAPTQQLQASAQAVNRVDAVGAQLAGLAQREGALKSSYSSGRIADEAKTVLSKQALGLDTAKAKQTAAVDAANIDLKRGVDPVTHKKIVKPRTVSDQKTAADLAFFKKHGYYPSHGAPKDPKTKTGKPTSGPGSITPVAENKIVAQARTLAGIIKSSPKVDDKGQPLTDAMLRKHLLDGTNPTGKPQDPAIVNMAFDLARKGGLSQPNVDAAHGMGVHVHGHFKIVKTAKKKAYRAPAGAVTGGGPHGDGT